MDSAAQFPAALCLAAAGAAAGLIYDLLSPLRFSKISAVIADLLFFAAAAFLYVFIATFCRLPDFRLYAYFAMAAGFIIYSKSMRSAIAFFRKMCYNSYEKARKRVFQPVFNAIITRISRKKQKRKAAREKKFKENSENFSISGRKTGEKSKRTRGGKRRGARKKVGL